MEADLRNENLQLIVKRCGRPSYDILMKNYDVKKKKKVAIWIMHGWSIHNKINNIHPSIREIRGKYEFKEQFGGFFYFNKNINHYYTA